MKQAMGIPDEQFEAAYLIIAAIVTKYGDRYLPVFRRMHEEKLQRKASSDLKAIALHVPSDGSRYS